MTRSDANRYRSIIEHAAQSLDDTMALEAVTLYPEWKPDTEYAVDFRVRCNGVLYRCITAHTSQVSWTPDVAHSLFAKVLIEDPTAIPEWQQPDSTNPYMTGDKVTHNGKTWVSDIDGNVWEPGVYGWSEVTV